MTSSFLGPIYAYIAILSCIGAFAGSPPSHAENSRKSARAAYQSRFLVLRGSSLPPGNQFVALRRLSGADEAARRQVSPKPDADAPPSFRRRVFFSPDSAALLAGGTRILRHTAQWLNQHPNARILIVGLCDPTGSEACHRSLAQKRGKVVRDFLVSRGVPEAQIEGVLGWERAAEPCRAMAETCQRLNRTTRVFVASAVVSGTEEEGDQR